MSILTSTKIFPASFRGIKFSFISHSVTGGRKVTVHEYVNQNTRTVEDLGGLPRTFTITARIFGSQGLLTGSDYFTQRDNLIAALNAPGLGELVHPFYGSVQVTPDRFTINETFNEINVAIFEMTFYQSVAPIYPQFTGNNVSFITKLQNQIISLIRTDYIDKFEITKSIRVNYQDSVALLGTISNTFDEVARLFSSDPDTNADFQEALNEFEDDIYPLANDPEGIIDSVSNLFDLSGNLGSNQRETFLIQQQFFGFGSQDIPISQTTAGRIQRAQNRFITNSMMNGFSLIKAYVAALNIDYTSDLDLDNTVAILEAQYQYLVSITTLSDDTMNQIEDLRVACGQFFEQLSITLQKINTVKTNDIPLLVFNYQYYANIDNYNTILTLNGFLNPERISGNVRILTN